MAEVAITWDGRELTVDLDSVTGREYDAIQRDSGLLPVEFLRSVASRQITGGAGNALIWLLRKRAGETVALADIDVPLLAVVRAIAVQPKATEEVPKDGEGGTTEASSTGSGSSPDSPSPSGS